MEFSFRRLLLAKRLASNPLRDVQRRLELLRLRYMPPCRRTITHLLGPPLTIPDARAFLFTFHEIFHKELYRFHAATERPTIIDGGANIGLSVLYFRRLYPQSRLIAFEPDPALFVILQDNLRAFGAKDIEFRQQALWVREEKMPFVSEGIEASRLTRTQDRPTHSVQAVRLRDYLTTPVDMLKLDIEGAEGAVLIDCGASLSNVRNIFVEYHSFAKEKQDLPELIEVLADAGFRLHIQAVRSAPQPFVRRDPLLDMDMQLNIFGFREQPASRDVQRLSA
jgi:FkbM family methyltransferase